MLTEDVETVMKVLVVGNGGVGKSSMIRRYCKGQYTENYKKTIGVDFLEKELSLAVTTTTGDAAEATTQAHDVRVMLWDTAGQEEFNAMTKSYYKGAHGVVLVFSTTDRASFEAVAGWKARVEAECPGVPCVLVQNKIDMMAEAVMQPSEAEDLAKQVKLKFYRVSVKDNLNVDEDMLTMSLSYATKLLRSTVFRYLGEVHLKTLAAKSSENSLEDANKVKIGVFVTEKDDDEDEDDHDSTSNDTNAARPPARAKAGPTLKKKKKKKKHNTQQDDTPGPDTGPSTRRTKGKKNECIIS